MGTKERARGSVETAGSRWTEGWAMGDYARAREDKRGGTEERKRPGAVFTKGHVACHPFFFFLTPPRLFDFSSPIVLNFPPRIFGGFRSRPETEGRRSVKSNSANVRQFPLRKHSGSTLWKN